MLLGAVLALLEQRPLRGPVFRSRDESTSKGLLTGRRLHLRIGVVWLPVARVGYLIRFYLHAFLMSKKRGDEFTDLKQSWKCSPFTVLDGKLTCLSFYGCAKYLDVRLCGVCELVSLIGGCGKTDAWRLNKST